jgi:hypothetical protein
MSIFPTISVNSDSVMKYKPNYLSFTGGAGVAAQVIVGKRFPYDSNRKIILAAATNGATLNIGLYPITTMSIGVTTVDYTQGSGAAETTFASGKITATWDGTGDTPNIVNMFAGTISLYFDDVKVAIDDGAGKWIEYGNSGLFLPDDDPGNAWNSTINYTTGAIVVYTVADSDYDITVSYTSDTVDSDTLLSVTGVAPLDLSAFLKNAPYSFHKENHDLIITPAILELATIAYASAKG